MHGSPGETIFGLLQQTAGTRGRRRGRLRPQACGADDRRFFGAQPLDLDARPEAETKDAACGILPVRRDADFVEAILLTGAGGRQAAAAGRATLRRRHDVIAAPALARRVERLSEVGRVRLVAAGSHVVVVAAGSDDE